MGSPTSGALEVVTRTRRWARTRGHDADAHADLVQRPLPLPRGLEVEWLGTSGYRLTYEGQTILIDPYLSRAPLREVVSRRPLLPDIGLIESHAEEMGSVVGVLVGHTHFDHAVDAPALAHRFGCAGYGSTSLQRLFALHGMAEQATVVEAHRDYELGPFRVRFVPSRHSKLIAGLAVPSSGELSCEHLESLSGSAYRCGQVWGIRIEVAGTVIYHQGSADVVEDELPDASVDVFLAGIAGRYASPSYFATMLRRLSPAVIVPTHYDDFLRPVDAPLGFSFNVNLAGFVDEMSALSRSVELASLSVLGHAPTTA